MKEPEKILEAKDICKAYGKNMVLNQVNLTIKAGEIYGLVGENGSGKTTTIKLILNMLKKNQGKIEILGYDNIKEEQIAGARI